MKYIAKKIVSVSFLLIGVVSLVSAQEKGVSFNTSLSLLQKYQGTNYQATHDNLRGMISTSSQTINVTGEEADFIKVKSSYLSGDANAKSEIKLYLKNCMNPTYISKANLMLGNLNLWENDFDEAERCYSKVNPSYLESSENEELALNKAILHLNKGENGMAEELLAGLSSKNSDLQIPATFYLGCAQYAQNRYGEAEEAFLKTQDDKTFSQNSRYYLANIHFVNKNYSLALKQSEELLKKDIPESFENPLKKICGESAFATGDVKKSIKYLEEYCPVNPSDLHSIYLLGVSYYNSKQYAKAIEALLKLTDSEEEYIQSAYLYLGHSYLAIGDKSGAIFAYEKAAESDIDIQAKESALYNYALLIDENNILPFETKVSVYENYIKLFPATSNAATINALLASSYMSTKNYEAALASVNKIENPDKELLKAKQTILYNLGVREYGKGQYNLAKKYFTQSIKVGDYNNDIVAKAYLWRGETNYLFKDYVNAESDYKKHISLAGKPQTSAYYSLAYTMFVNKRYGEAEKMFGKYISNRDSDKYRYADAYNRKGDCLYMMRRYKEALKSYAEAENIDSRVGDYSMYMQGIVYGVEKEYKDKIAQMDQMVKRYPVSGYAPKALEQKGMAELAIDRNSDALDTFAKLYTNYPQTQEAVSALLQSAVICMNQNSVDKAVSAYKTLIETYPGSNEATIAMEDLKNIYIQQGDVKPYGEYLKSVKGEGAYRATEMDSLTYYAAENIFMRSPNNQSVEQLKNYISEYPSGAFLTNAAFYVGQYCFNNNNSAAARQYLQMVLDKKDMLLGEEALSTLATIEENEQNYEKAYSLYDSLIKNYPTSKLAKESKLSLVRVAYLSGDNDKTIADATAIIESGDEIPNVDKIKYYRAKAYGNRDEDENALKDWEYLSVLTSCDFASEAKYMVATNLFENGKLNESESVVNSLLSGSASDQYWIAKSIILLSDISAKRGDSFKAKQYLNSLKNNYTSNEEINKIINTKLKKYEK